MKINDNDKIKTIEFLNNGIRFCAFAILMIVGILFLGVNIENNKNTLGFSENISKTDSANLGVILPDIGQVNVDYYKKLADYLASKIGYSHINLITTNSTDELVNLINQKKIDFYIGSSLTSALVDNKTGSVPFLTTENRAGDKTHSVIITKRITGPLQIFLLVDLTGKKLGITDVSSGLEYLLPKAYLVEHGLTVNPLPQPPLNASKTSVNYVVTGGADNTISQILNGKLGAGVVSIETYNHQPKTIKSNLKVLGITNDVPLDIVSYRPDLDPTVVDVIKHALDNNTNSAGPIPKGDKNIKFVEFNNKPLFSNLTKMAILSSLYNSCDPVQIFTVKDYC